jgi:hypothetical protein
VVKYGFLMRPLQLSGRHTADHCLAFIADNLGNVAADNAIEASAAIRITEAFMH